MIDIIVNIWNFILDNFFILAGIIIVLLYGKYFYKTFVFDPLAGGNGKIQMDELAKGIVIAVLIWAVHRDGHRAHEWTYFTDAFYAALLAALFAIATIKPVASVLKHNRTQPTQPTKNDTTTKESERSTPEGVDDTLSV